jgi:hypothetical protein
MGTGAVYVTLSGVRGRFHGLVIIETVFYFINMALFIVNSTTLMLQLFCE